MSGPCKNGSGLWWIALAFGLGGCEAAPLDDLPRQAVEGTVTVRGKPLEAGSIEFQPVASGTQMVLGNGAIKDGTFTIPRATGLVPGEYKVKVSSVPPAEPLAPGTDPGGLPKRPKETIPAKYNVKTTLTAKINDSGSNKLEFALPD